MKSLKKILEIPAEYLGRTLPAAVSDIRHEYKYAIITVDVVLPGDGGILPVTKKIWYMYPSKEEKDFVLHNKAAMKQWRDILEIPAGLTDREFVESIETLALMDEVNYSLEVSFEKGASGNPYMKILSYTVEEKHLSTAPIRKKYKAALLDLRRSEENVAVLEKRISSMTPPVSTEAEMISAYDFV